MAVAKKLFNANSQAWYKEEFLKRQEKNAGAVIASLKLVKYDSMYLSTANLAISQITAIILSTLAVKGLYRSRQS